MRYLIIGTGVWPHSVPLIPLTETHLFSSARPENIPPPLVIYHRDGTAALGIVPNSRIGLLELAKNPGVIETVRKHLTTAALPGDRPLRWHIINEWEYKCVSPPTDE